MFASGRPPLYKEEMVFEEHDAEVKDVGNKWVNTMETKTTISLQIEPHSQAEASFFGTWGYCLYLLKYWFCVTISRVFDGYIYMEDIE